MKRFTSCVVVLSAIALAGVAWADQEIKEPQVRLALDLIDGSHIIGIPHILSVPVQTSYAKMDVPLKHIFCITLSEDHETASVDLQNGDKLKGSVRLAPINLETAFGDVSVGMEHVKKLRVVLSGGALPGALRKGLVLYYSFDRDEGGTVTDESGKGNHGTVHGAKWERFGDGGVYDFHGSLAKGDYIEVPNSASLVSMERTRQLTLALWIKPRTIQRDFPDLICKGGNQPPYAHGGYELILNGVGDNDICFVSGAFDSTTFHANGKWTNQHMNEWIHIVLTLDASTGKEVCYINGKPTNDLRNSAGGDLSFGGIKFDLPNNLYIGRADPRHHPNRGRFDGAMGELQIYDRTMSPEDVNSLYGTGTGKYSVRTGLK